MIKMLCNELFEEEETIFPQIFEYNNRSQTLLLGDCIEEMKKMDEKSIDLICSSPPFNSNQIYRSYKDNLPRQKYLSWMNDVFKEIKRIIKDDGSFFLNVGFTSTDPWIATDVAKEASNYFILQNTIVWLKSFTFNNITHGHFKPVNSKRYVNRLFEYVFHFTSTGKVGIDRLAIGVSYKDSGNINRWKKHNKLKCRGNIWFIPYATIRNKAERGNHPATFPSELAENCIKLHGIKKDMVVLDPFLGIGSTLIATTKLGVKGIGVDIDEEYLKVAARKIREMSV